MLLQEVWRGQALREIKRMVSERRYQDNKACDGCTYFKVSHDPETNIDRLIATDSERALSVP